MNFYNLCEIFLQNLAEKLAQLDVSTDCTVFDYIRNVIDERNALID
jgi:hypothetical protein